MKTYIGTKVIKAKPMTKKEYCDYRGWPIPPNEDPKEAIMLVEYPEDPLSKPNHGFHKGYISMSPLHVFEKAYKPADTYMDRLLIERDELNVKLEALLDALKTRSVPDSSRAILAEQGNAMTIYRDILDKRINE